MYSVETCGVCVHECKCAYEYPCSDCNVLRSYCKENHFEEAEKDDEMYSAMFCFGLGMIFGLFGGL